MWKKNPYMLLGVIGILTSVLLIGVAFVYGYDLGRFVAEIDCVTKSEYSR